MNCVKIYNEIESEYNRIKVIRDKKIDKYSNIIINTKIKNIEKVLRILNFVIINLIEINNLLCQYYIYEKLFIIVQKRIIKLGYIKKIIKTIIFNNR